MLPLHSFALPTLIIDRRPCLAIFPLPHTSVVTLSLHCPCHTCAGRAPLSPCPCLVNAIIVCAPPPPPQPLQYAYLLAIANNIRPCIGCAISCLPCQHWRQRCYSKPSALNKKLLNKLSYSTYCTIRTDRSFWLPCFNTVRLQWGSWIGRQRRPVPSISDLQSRNILEKSQKQAKSVASNT